jgi:hypothetical protein
MSEYNPRSRLCNTADICADCGRAIPNRVYVDDVNLITIPPCTCKPWTQTRPKGEE